MTRTAAALLSMFGPLFPAILIVLFFAFFDNKPPTWLGATGVVVMVIAALSMRIYFGVWYARDKGRSGALGLMALFGLLGWLFLILTEDHKPTSQPWQVSSNPT